MKKDYTPILLFFIILAIEAAPLFYKEGYKISDMGWVWIFGLPVVLLLLNRFKRPSAK